MSIVGYLMAYVSLCIVISIGPLILLTLLFEKTRSMFDNWLNIMLGYVLQPSFIIIFILFINQLTSGILIAANFGVKLRDLLEVTLNIPDLNLNLGTLFTITGYAPITGSGQWGPTATDVMDVLRISGLFFCLMKLIDNVTTIAPSVIDKLITVGDGSGAASAGRSMQLGDNNILKPTTDALKNQKERIYEDPRRIITDPYNSTVSAGKAVRSGAESAYRGAKDAVTNVSDAFSSVSDAFSEGLNNSRPLDLQKSEEAKLQSSEKFPDLSPKEIDELLKKTKIPEGASDDEITKILDKKANKLVNKKLKQQLNNVKSDLSQKFPNLFSHEINNLIKKAGKAGLPPEEMSNFIANTKIPPSASYNDIKSTIDVKSDLSQKFPNLSSNETAQLIKEARQDSLSPKDMSKLIKDSKMPSGASYDNIKKIFNVKSDLSQNFPDLSSNKINKLIQKAEKAGLAREEMSNFITKVPSGSSYNDIMNTLDAKSALFKKSPDLSSNETGQLIKEARQAGLSHKDMSKFFKDSKIPSGSSYNDIKKILEQKLKN